MVFRGTNGKACRINCYESGAESVTHRWSQQRRSLFKKKVLFVEKDSTVYWLRMSLSYPARNSYWSIDCWFPGDKDKAKACIGAAFSALQAMAKTGKAEEWAKTLLSLR